MPNKEEKSKTSRVRVTEEQLPSLTTPLQPDKAEPERQRHSRSSSAEVLTEEPLVFVPQRQRNAVSRREDDTDSWGIDELDNKEEHRLVLRDNSLKSTILSRLHTFRKNRELCDVILFVKEREIIGHKVVLAAMSPALYNMFTTEETESETSDSVKGDAQQASSRGSVGPNNTMSYFEFNQGGYECFEALVEFAYTGVLSISSLKIADLYKTAFALQVNSVAAACARYLAENLSCGNCIGIRRHANFNNDTILVDRVDSFIVENFEKIVNESVEFTKLPCIKTRIIVPHNGEQIDDDTAASLATRAIAYFQLYPKISERVEQQIEALTQKSHLLFVDADAGMLEDCSKVNDETTLGCSEVVQDYKRSMQSKASKTAGHNSQQIGIQIAQHHVTGALPVKINASRVANSKYASNESLNSMASSATDVDEEIESQMVGIHQISPGYWIALAVLHKRLVVLSIQLTDDEGLAVSAADTPSFESNNTADADNTLVDGVTPKKSSDPTKAPPAAKPANASDPNQEPVKNMSSARCSVGAAYLNGKIVVCGGYDRGECLKTVEEYDLETRRWRALPAMKTERGRFDAAVIDGRIYAVAGSNGNNDLQSVECFDPHTQTWESIASLNKARSHNACASLDGFIYCCGGSSEQKVLRDCERFDSSAGKWEPIAPMQTGRCQSGCVAWKGLIVVCAGSNNWNCLDTVEAYDPKTGSWRQLAKLNTPRRGCAVAVLGDALYVIGGHDGTNSLRTSEILADTGEKWRAGPSLNIPRANTHAVSTEKAIYVIGGFNNEFLSSMEVLESDSPDFRFWVYKRAGDKKGGSASEEDEANSEAGLRKQESTKTITGERAGSVTPRASSITVQ